MKETASLMDMGVTFQMSLDSFLEESHPEEHKEKTDYARALTKLEESRRVRSWEKKQQIAQSALKICPDCIEAYMVLGSCEEDYIERLQIFRRGMELATMNLGKEFFLNECDDYFALEEAKALFHIKYAYACSLYEAGYMRKAQQQFQEILNLNPIDEFRAHYYLYALALYFEELEQCRQLLERFAHDGTMGVYVRFIYDLKMDRLKDVSQRIKDLRAHNRHLYDLLTYRTMNTVSMVKDQQPGSEEEAGYVYHILSKVLQIMEYLHIFLIRNEE